MQGTLKARSRKSVASTVAWAANHDSHAANIKKTRSTMVSRLKTSKQAKAQWADPVYAAAQSANNKEIASRPEVKAAKAAALKARWADPEFKVRMLAARTAKKSIDSVAR